MLIVLTVALAWWMLLAKEISTAVLAPLVAGVLGASWLARRLLRTAALGEVGQRHAGLGVTVGGLVIAACLGSMSNGGHGSPGDRLSARRHLRHGALRAGRPFPTSGA